jgi:hypothetical protein
MHWLHKWTYALWYFRSYDQGTALVNSEDSVGDMIDTVVETFEDSEQLGFVGSEIDFHDGFQANGIDTVDNKMHMVMGELIVTLTSQ